MLKPSKPSDYIIPNLPDDAVNQIRDWAIKLKNTTIVTDILPWLRRLSKNNPGLLDHFTLHDHLLSHMYWGTSDVKGLTVTMANLMEHSYGAKSFPKNSNPDNWAIRDDVGDFAILGLRFTCEDAPDGFLDPEKEPAAVLSILISWLIYDCTDCCNALSYVRLSANGVFATGDISMTYHS